MPSVMARFTQPQRHRNGSVSQGSHRRPVPRGLSTQSTSRPGSQYSTHSNRRSIAASQSRSASHSQRLASAGSSRAFQGDRESVHAADQASDDSTLDDSTLSEVIMAVNVSNKGTVGCAYYVARNETLYFMEDVGAGGTAIVDSRQYILGCPFSIY